MTESSSSTATTIISPQNDLENDPIDSSPTLDNQSEEKSLSSIETNINPSANVSYPFVMQSNHYCRCQDQVTSKRKKNDDDMQHFELY